jgi:hypothetical protein
LDNYFGCLTGEFIFVLCLRCGFPCFIKAFFVGIIDYNSSKSENSLLLFSGMNIDLDK